MDCGALEQVVQALVAAVDEVIALDRVTVSDDDLAELLQVCEQQKRRLEHAQLATIADVSRRGLAGALTYRDTRAMLADRLALTTRAAAARVELAEALAAGRAVTGELLPVALPATAAASEAGELATEQASVIARAVRELPAPLCDRGGDLEQILATQAVTLGLNPVALTKAAAHALAWLDPDGPVPAECERYRGEVRRFRLRRVESGAYLGMGEVSGLLTPECTAMLEAILAAPAPEALETSGPAAESSVADSAVTEGAVAEGAVDGGAADGSVPDIRTANQRDHDRLAHALRLALESDGLGSANGSAATVIVTLTIDDLERRAGHATTATGGVLSIEQALRLAADGRFLPAVLTGEGEPLYVGRAKRLATRAQRRALIARDAGCTFPGCAVPASGCRSTTPRNGSAAARPISTT